MNYKHGKACKDKKYYCVDCDKQLSKSAYQGTIRCYSCEGKRKHREGVCNVKGKNNPMFGKKNLKLILWNKTHSHKGNLHWNYKGGKQKVKCNFCNKIFETTYYKSKQEVIFCSRNCYNKMVIKLGLRKGRNNGMFGKIVHPKYIKYNNIWMHSTWEVAYAKYLDRQKIKWTYEPKTFDLGDCTYTPDFYLSERDSYIEIKGYWRTDAKKKFRLFKKLYSNVKINILEYEDLKKERIIK